MAGRPAPDPVLESARALPSAALRPFVAWYSGYRQAGLPPGRHRGLPSPYLTFIITLDDPLTVAAHPDPRQEAGRYDTLIGGLHTAPALITHPGCQSGIQLGLHPLAARALLGLPAGELANTDLDAAAILGRLASEMRERVRYAASWRDRFAILDDMLLRHVRVDRLVPVEVAGPWSLISSGDPIAIADMARDLGWSNRRLGQQFQREVGLSPKTAARVVRFDRARRLLQRRGAAGEPLALADLAAACGYYDQAHLARDFREFAGSAPSRWMAEELRNVQAASQAGLPEWGHEQ